MLFRQLRNPKNWPIVLIFSLAKLITFFPLSLQVLLGRSLGKVIYMFASRRRNIARININLCFPELSDEEKTALIKENFALTGLAFIETAACWFSQLKKHNLNTTVKGKEHLKQALEKGKGVILLSFHMTSLEIGGSLLAKHFSIIGMYKPNKNPLLEDIMTSGRLRHVDKMLKQSDVRGTVKALKNNQAIWYATDQNYGNKSSVFVPFFGIQASTITATTKFTKLTGATVIPFTQKRSKDGKHFELTLHPALENFPGENEIDDATRINQFLENYLKQNPEDYMWIHQRFRSRPTGEPSIYPKKMKKKKSD